MPFSFPDWVPWWVPMTLLVPALLFALAFLFMPFSVLGVKSRLEAVEERLFEIQQELRILTGDLSGPRQELDYEDVYAPPPPRHEAHVRDRPPIPPTLDDYDADYGRMERPPMSSHARQDRRQDTAPPRATRAEPRLDRR